MTFVHCLLVIFAFAILISIQFILFDHDLHKMVGTFVMSHFAKISHRTRKQL